VSVGECSFRQTYLTPEQWCQMRLHLVSNLIRVLRSALCVVGGSWIVAREVRSGWRLRGECGIGPLNKIIPAGPLCHDDKTPRKQSKQTTTK
jgi:hypothetical protein